MSATDANGNPGIIAAGELIESAWGNAVVTHVVRAGPESARPGAPHVGARWYATDTKREYTYHATNGWVRSDWNSAWGFMSTAFQSGNFGVGGVAGEQAMLSTTAIPFVDGRRLRITFDASYVCTVAGDYYALAIRQGVGIAGTVQKLNRISAGSPTGGDFLIHFECDVVMTTAGGSPTQWTLTANRTVGTGNISFYGSASWTNALTVHDIGPVTRI